MCKCAVCSVRGVYRSTGAGRRGLSLHKHENWTQSADALNVNCCEART